MRLEDAVCVRFGVRYGQACVGACWALMLPMAIAGHAGLPVMIMVTAIVVAEEVVVKGVRLVTGAALILITAAAAVGMGAWEWFAAEPLTCRRRRL
jgi:predicted metal-binding membrane protein